MTDDDVLIEAEALTRDYGSLRAVDAVDLQVRRGEIVGLLGPNGAGKSSTLGMICGTLAPSAGRVAIAGVDLIDQPRRAKRNLGYLPENPPLYPDMTVDEYLGFCAGLRGLRGGERRRAVAVAVERCNLGAERRRLLAQLSKGFRQRAGIAQAILHNPAVIVLDEPTVGLDPIQVREIRELIASLAAEHAVILSTHILPEVQSVCSHVRIMHRGRIAWSDSLAHFGRGDGPQRIIVGLADGAELPEGLPGVTGASELGDGRYRVTMTADEDAIEQLAAALVATGRGLRELTPEAASLEQVFVDVTAADRGAADAAATRSAA